MQDPVIFGTSGFVQRIQCLDQQISIVVQQLFRLLAAPQIVPASLAEAVTVLARKEAAGHDAFLVSANPTCWRARPQITHRHLASARASKR